VLPPPITNKMVITPAMIFAQRLALYFNTRDRKIIAIGISSNVEPANSSPNKTDDPFVVARDQRCVVLIREDRVQARAHLASRGGIPKAAD
jgi:hypothetical protein